MSDSLDHLVTSVIVSILLTVVLTIGTRLFLAMIETSIHPIVWLERR